MHLYYDIEPIYCIILCMYINIVFLLLFILSKYIYIHLYYDIEPIYCIILCVYTNIVFLLFIIIYII